MPEPQISPRTVATKILHLQGHNWTDVATELGVSKAFVSHARSPEKNEKFNALQLNTIESKFYIPRELLDAAA